jgi:hypothetical protein
MANQKLEKVLEYLINKDEEKARKLLHQIFVEKAREIHESLMQEDDALGMGDASADEIGDDQDQLESDEMTFEEYFGDDDLGDEEGTEGGDGGIEDAAGDVADELSGDGVEGDEADDAIDSGDIEGGEESDLAAQIEDLEARFDELQSSFDALNGEGAEAPEGDDDLGGDIDGDIDGEEVDGETASADDAEGEEGEEETTESASIYGEEDVFEELDALLGADFDDLTESALDELDTVKVTMSDAEIGKGGRVTQNNVSPMPSHPKGDRANKAKPVEVKSSQHSGYDREAAPGTKSGTGATSPRNVNKSAPTGTKVSKEGDKSATLNSGKGFGAENNKSPLNTMGAKNMSK